MKIHRTVQCPNRQHWHVDKVCQRELPAAERVGRVVFHLYDEHNDPAEGVDVLLYGNALSMETTSQDGVAQVHLYDRADFHSSGPNIATVVDEPADQVDGVGLVEGLPTEIEIVFRWRAD